MTSTTKYEIRLGLGELPFHVYEDRYYVTQFASESMAKSFIRGEKLGLHGLTSTN